MGNGGGSYPSTRANKMAAFDKLPRTVREALASADFDWATQPVLTMWRRSRGNSSAAQLIASQVPTWDAGLAAKQRKKVWGIDDAPARSRSR